jgi:DNA-binding GntR family transcriptional regulator
MPGSKRGTKASERIYQDIRQSIILGRYRPGDRLNADALAEDYGVSNTPVREALQMLRQEELVSIKPHSGYFVTQITLRQLRDLLQMREILEVAAVELAAVRITEKELEELEHIHSGSGNEDEEPYVGYIMENRRFHYLVARASGNRELAESLGHLHDRLNPYWVMVHPGDVMARIHQRLIDALRKHDVALAKQCILDEVRETREATLERVIREGGDIWIIGEQMVLGSQSD